MLDGRIHHEAQGAPDQAGRRLTASRRPCNHRADHAGGPPIVPRTPAVNTLFYGDNLHVLREHIADESVDLVYLDPPFNSNAADYVLFNILSEVIDA